MSDTVGPTPSLFTNPNTQLEFKRYLIDKKGFLFFVFFFISAIILFFAITDPKFLTSRTLLYIAIIAAPICVGFYLTSKVTINTNILMMFAGGMLLLGVMGGAIYLIQNLGLNLVLMNYIFYIIFGLILLIGLSITYIIFSNAIRRQQGAAGFWIRLIFFIPCLINDFIEYIRQEFRITPPTLVWLLILELLLLILHAYIPVIIQLFTYNPKNSLMAYPIYLSDPHTIATSERFLMTTLNNPDKYKDGSVKPEQTTVTSTKNSVEVLNATFRNANYAFSFWVFINQGNISKKAYIDGTTNIFTYGKYDGTGLSENAKPQITYANDAMIVYFAGSKSPPQSIAVPNQMWVNVVVNYGSDHADLYLNGALKFTYSYTNGIPPPGMEEDKVVVAHTDGLDGSIRDVRYFDSYLTHKQVAELYNAGFVQNYKPELKL